LEFGLPVSAAGPAGLVEQRGKTGTDGRPVTSSKSAPHHLEHTMPDDRRKRGPPDRMRINVGEPHEHAYWTKELGCTEAKLRATLKAVGPMMAAVRNHLNRR
jgi:hypothetical protein